MQRERRPHHGRHGLGCHSAVASHKNCHDGEHEHLTDQTDGCHPTGRQHYNPYTINVTEATFAGIFGGAVCYLAATATGPGAASCALACAGG